MSIAPLLRSLLASTLIIGCAPNHKPIDEIERLTSNVEAVTGAPDLCPGWRLQETAQERVRLRDGREVFVEPMVFTTGHTGELLIAGTPSYVWGRDERGKGALESESEVIAVLRSADGDFHAISSPVAGVPIREVRATQRDDGTWIFILVEPTTLSIDRAPVRRVWYGEFDGERWAAVDTLPLPGRASLITSRGSHLVASARGDAAWATPNSPPGTADEVVVFVQRDGIWAYEIIPARAPAYVALAHDATEGWIAVIVHPDVRERSDTNSLLIWGGSPDWRILGRRIFGAVEGAVHHPHLTFGRGGGAISWLAEPPEDEDMWVLRTGAGGLTGEFSDVVDVAVVSAPRFAALRLDPSDEPLWAIHDGRGTGGAGHLTLLTRDSSGVRQVFSEPNAFSTEFNGATAALDQTVLVSGPLFDASDSLLVSVVQRLTPVCPSPEARGR